MEKVVQRNSRVQTLRYAIPVKSGCFTLSGSSGFNVLYEDTRLLHRQICRWISDTNPNVTGEESNKDAVLWEPNFAHTNPLSSAKEVHDNAFLRHYCNFGPGPHYIWVYAILFPSPHQEGKQK